MKPLKRLQAETAAELDALLPAILQSSPGFDPTAPAPSKENCDVSSANEKSRHVHIIVQAP